MVSKASLLSLLSAFTLACANPTPPDLRVHEHLDAIPNGFVRNGAPSDDTSLKLRIALVSNNMPGLEKALYDVSTPSSKLYGQHLTKEEVETFVAPTSETTTAVNEWLASNGLRASPISPAGDWIGFSLPVKKANELLNAEFLVFTHHATEQTAIRTLSYSIPASLKGHIDFVYPATAFPVYSEQRPVMLSPLPKSNLSERVAPASCATLMTPGCLQQLYNIPASVLPQTASQIVVTAFPPEYAQVADLSSFLLTFRPDLPPNLVYGFQSVDGGVDPQGPQFAGSEANLDVQYTVGLAGGVPTTFISSGVQTNDGVFGNLNIALFLLAQSFVPQVLSTSYGVDERLVSPLIFNNLCNAYMQLGARGVSVLFSSGDGGVAGFKYDGQVCTNFVPTFPSGCPFLTSVGATQGVNPEAALSVSAGASSGGFSNIFFTPPYQVQAVSTYLAQLGAINVGRYAPNGRAYPDISTQGSNVPVIVAGKVTPLSGTSCSTPILASIIGMLNAELLAVGRPPLGFLNPLIYTIPGAFNDITSGSNPGCGTSGFPALPGWDPVTGVGTPNYSALRLAVGLVGPA